MYLAETDSLKMKMHDYPLKSCCKLKCQQLLLVLWNDCDIFAHFLLYRIELVPLCSCTNRVLWTRTSSSFFPFLSPRYIASFWKNKDLIILCCCKLKVSTAFVGLFKLLQHFCTLCLMTGVELVYSLCNGGLWSRSSSSFLLSFLQNT